MNAVAVRQGFVVWVLFLAGPVIWISHFMAVYLVAEAACTIDNRDYRVLGLHPVSWVTLGATAVAVAASLILAAYAFAYWRARRDPGSDWLAGDERNHGLTLAGALLGLVFSASILFVGLPAAFLDPC